MCVRSLSAPERFETDFDTLRVSVSMNVRTVRSILAELPGYYYDVQSKSRATNEGETELSPTKNSGNL